MKDFPNGTITDLAGFQASGVHCGIKPDGVLDLALIVSERPCSAAAVFTKNRIKAAPVLYDQTLLKQNATTIRAIVINSGNANAVTGKQGLADAIQMAELTSQAIGCNSDEIFVMSTGIIGEHLDMAKIRAGITQAADSLSPDGGHMAARAIMTTDTISKETAVHVNLSIGETSIAGMAKGSGMIHPNMATMLSIIATDATISQHLLDQALRYAVDRSFNRITVDGETSTNDTVLLLANGVSNKRIDDDASQDFLHFRDALTMVTTILAQKIVRDGEGANKFVTVHVYGALTVDDAHKVAKTIAHSPLVKTAMYGEDANWGRVLCAIGYSEAQVSPDLIGLRLAAGSGFDGASRQSLQLVKEGQPYQVDETIAAEILAGTDIDLEIDLGRGSAEATVWTCDLSPEYISINGDYRT